MELLINAITDSCWATNTFGVGLIALTRFFNHTKIGWALVGLTLVIIAFGNTIIMINIGQNPSQHIASIFSTFALGSLGVRFIGNWITDGAK
ncbi:hypothetical protein [Paludibacterium denitrificans]|uniref:Uncharacterized protein n=1 Tax=Paludibacterium denitrificans TaxID=2675226 RepID=A0A844GB32_9NEIS|nr:hypothetical protein [Paludibacterium denitrificans]MTD32501.1 hypothetical protein [Paludibacterium denitrificans]